MIGEVLKTGELRVPEDGPVSWTARDDLAEVDSAILTPDEDWKGVTPAPTATDAVTMAEVAQTASEVLGREIRHTTVSDKEWVEAKVKTGMPALYAEMLLGIFRAARRGDFAATDPTLETLLGRRPKTLRDVIAATEI